MASAHLSPVKNTMYLHRACLGGIMRGSYTICPAHLLLLGNPSADLVAIRQYATDGKLDGEKNLCRTCISKCRCPTGKGVRPRVHEFGTRSLVHYRGDVFLCSLPQYSDLALFYVENGRRGVLLARSAGTGDPRRTPFQR